MLAPLLLVLLTASACGSSSTAATATATPQPVTLKVFAADSLTAVFTKLGNQFHTLHPNVTLSFNFAGSNTLAAQINQGAPADVFASANLTQMNVVVSAGGIDASSVQVFAHNHIVVIIPKSNPGNITTLQDLAKPGIKIVLGASSVPAGAYALQFLASASADPSFGSSYKANFLKNVVSYQTDVGGVLSQVTTGDADAGIVYISDADTDAQLTFDHRHSRQFEPHRHLSDCSGKELGTGQHGSCVCRIRHVQRWTECAGKLWLPLGYRWSGIYRTNTSQLGGE